MICKYKYDPADYKDVLNLYNELFVFYELLEVYKENRTRANKLSLNKHSRDLFFTIKHRELEGNITHITAEGLREYMRDLMYD